MYRLFVLLSGLLTILLLQQIWTGKKHRHQLSEITRKLEEIIVDDTREKIHIFTEDPSLVTLSIQLNELLKHNQKILAKHAQTELAMRKMLSNISHDLKTPLTVIIGYLETVSAETDLPEETKIKLRKAYQKSLELLFLIREFFSLAKLESGDERFPLSKINLNEVCRKSILEYHEILSGKEWQVHIDIPEEPIFCLGNEDALGRILDNLISNAISYGADGKTLGLSLYRDGGFISIEVWDRGKGISEIDQERVFERLYTLEDSRNKDYQGSGLGLTISMRLAEVLGGDIRVKSRAFEETVFTVRLPEHPLS